MSLEALLSGRVLLGRYRIDEVLGRGGMGVVYRATDLRLDRPVAVKVLAPFLLSGEGRARARSRFRREAMAAARLRHPHVVDVYDYGTEEELDLDLLVMPLLEGQELGEWVRACGASSPAMTVELLRQAACGLGAGHRLGLLHRDVKPGNLFVSGSADRPHLRVLDFGIVDLVDAEGTLTHLTVAGHSPFTPVYASPEQLRGDAALTPATDVFSLAVVGVELLTGEKAFTGADPHEREAASMRLRRRLEAHGLPAHLIEVLSQALAALKLFAAVDSGPRDRARTGSACACSHEC